MSAPAARSAALSLYRQYLRTAAGVPKLHVRVSTRRAVRMAFRARAYDYLTAAAGDGGVGAAEAAAEEWIRHGREDLGRFFFFFASWFCYSGEGDGQGTAKRSLLMLCYGLWPFAWVSVRAVRWSSAGRLPTGRCPVNTSLLCVKTLYGSRWRTFCSWPCCAVVCGLMLVAPPFRPWCGGSLSCLDQPCLLGPPSLTVTWQALTRMDPAALNAVLFPGPPAADASVAATAPRGGDATPSGHSGAGT